MTAAARHASGKPKSVEIRSLWRDLQARSVNIHEDRSLNEIHLEYDSKILALAKRDSIEAREWPAYDSDAPALLNVGKWLSPRAFCNRGAKILYFVFVYRLWYAAKLHEAHEARNLQDSQPIPKLEMDEHITREERQLEPLAAILPNSHRFVERQIVFDRSPRQLRRHGFFVICSRMGCIPMRLACEDGRGSYESALARQNCVDAFHHSPLMSQLQLRPATYRAA